MNVVYFVTNSGKYKAACNDQSKARVTEHLAITATPAGLRRLQYLHVRQRAYRSTERQYAAAAGTASQFRWVTLR